MVMGSLEDLLSPSGSDSAVMIHALADGSWALWVAKMAMMFARIRG